MFRNGLCGEACRDTVTVIPVRRISCIMRVRARYTGRVQGVGFRATAFSLAENRPISGWVRNEPDGGVVLEAQGEDPDVRAYLDSLRRVMAHHIHGVDVIPIDNLAGEIGFRIVR